MLVHTQRLLIESFCTYSELLYKQKWQRIKGNVRSRNKFHYSFELQGIIKSLYNRYGFIIAKRALSACMHINFFPYHFHLKNEHEHKEINVRCILIA